MATSTTQEKRSHLRVIDGGRETFYTELERMAAELTIVAERLPAGCGDRLEIEASLARYRALAV